MDRHAHWHRQQTSAGLPVMLPTEKPVPLDSPARPPVSYWGGKFNARRKIVEKMPPHKTYVEPFAGGANVLLAKPPSQREVIGDKNPAIMKVHRSVKAKAQVWKMSPSRAKWEKIRHTPPSQRSAEDQAYLLRHSFSGQGRNYVNHYRGRDSDTGKAHDREKDVFMVGTDFATTMQRWDSEQTLHYLDPPYVKGGQEYEVTGVTPARVAQVAGKMKGKVMVSYDDRPEVRKAFKGKKWRQNRISFLYRGNKSSKNQNKVQNTELLITNYDIGKTRTSTRPFDESRAKKELHT